MYLLANTQSSLKVLQGWNSPFCWAFQLWYFILSYTLHTDQINHPSSSLPCSTLIIPGSAITISLGNLTENFSVTVVTFFAFRTLICKLVWFVLLIKKTSHFKNLCFTKFQVSIPFFIVHSNCHSCFYLIC